MAKTDRKFPLNPHLRRAREDRGWSQKDLAHEVGTTFVNVSRWENGTTFPTPHFRQLLCQKFGKTPAELGLVPPAQDFRLADIPIMRNPFFTGRQKLLTLLHMRLSSERAAALTQAQTLYGLGGIGKTQTAAEYVFRFGEEYAQVFWIRAASRETLVADMVRLAERLELTDQQEQDQTRVIAAFKRWLATHEGWLLVLDNADDLPLVQTFLPNSHKGFILFTTRAAAAGSIAAAVEVEKLSVQEGILLLLRWTKRLGMDASLEQALPSDRAVAERIAQEMDGLPLALVQAGAYIEETGCSLADYLRLYAAHRKELLARRSRLLFDYPLTVATTWSLSFEQVEQESPAAAEVLRYCAFLAPDVIPEALLMGDAAEPGGAPGAMTSDAFALNEALEVVRRYSLVQRDGSAHTLRIHRLVQAVLRDSLDEEIRRVWAERTVRAVNAAFPEVDYDPSKSQQGYLQAYLPHVQECATLITQYHLSFPEAGRLLYQAADFLYVHGSHPQSHSLHEQALAIREQVLDAEDPATADSLNALAILARLQGNYEQAEAFHRRALAIRETALGPDDPATALSLNNLSVVYRSQGKYEQAEPLLKRALSTSMRSGSENPDTLLALLNLAKLYLEQRKYEQAEQLLKQALATSERVLEPEHPLIGQNLIFLARLYYEQGSYEQAETLWKQALALIKKALGPEHPVTAGLLNDLAEVYFAQSRYTQAQSLCQQAISICEKRLGSEHPDTIAYRQHLARIMSKQEVELDGDHHPVPPVN